MNLNKEYTLEDFAVALVSRLPLKEQREEVLKHLSGGNLARAREVHEEQNKLEEFDIEDAREYLEEIIELEGTEVGRTLSLMLELYDDDGGGEELGQRLKHEIYMDYLYFKKNFEIVEEDFVPAVRKVRKLVEKNI